MKRLSEGLVESVLLFHTRVRVVNNERYSYFEENVLLTTPENYIRKRAKIKFNVYPALVEFASGRIANNKG